MNQVPDCGKAVYLAETTALARITGFDLPGIFRPEVAVGFARERGVEDRCRFTTGQAEDISFADSQFEVVLMDDVLEHVADPKRVLSECRRVLKPGGVVVVRFPSIRMLRAHHFDRALSFPVSRASLLDADASLGTGLQLLPLAQPSGRALRAFQPCRLGEIRKSCDPEPQWH